MFNVLMGNYKVEAGWKIGLICSRFNTPVTEPLERGCVEKLASLGFKPEQVTQVRIPGAFEAPLVAEWMLENNLDGVIVLGAVIRGETSHYDYVCNAVERGCSELQLKYKKPVVFGVLTTENKEQAFDRIGGKKGHKGVDCAEVLVEMLSLKSQLKS